MKQFTFTVPSSIADLKAAASIAGSTAKATLSNVVPKRRRYTQEQIDFERARIAQFLSDHPEATLDQYMTFRNKIEGAQGAD